MTSSALVQRHAPPRPLHRRPPRARTRADAGRSAGRRRSARRAALGRPAFAAPALACSRVRRARPVLQSVNYSLYSWDGVSAADLGRVRATTSSFFTDPDLLESLGHVLVLICFFALLPIALGLFSAALLGRGETAAAAAVYRWLLFLPQVLTTVVVARDLEAHLRPGRPAQRGAARRRARRPGQELAGRLHLGAARARRHRHLGDASASAWSSSSPARRRSRRSSTRRRASTAPARSASSSRSPCPACAGRSPSR